MNQLRKITTCMIWGLAVLAGLAIAGVDRGGVTVGVLERSAGLVVDSIEFDVSDAIVVANGDVVDENHLVEGQVVTVYGPVSADGVTGEAITIMYDDNVDGPIEWIDRYADDGLFRALGQLVRVTQDTVYSSSISPASIHGLQTGLHVEVSGIMIENDEILATYVGLQAPGSGLEVSGFAENVDTGKRTFEINDLTVNYRDAAMVGFLDNHPENDNLVEARGVRLTNSGNLIAMYLEKKSIISGKPGDQLLLDGLVSNFESLSSVFLVAGTPVYIDGDTDFDGGNANSIGDTVRLRLDGHFDDDGVLRADYIEFYPYH